MRIFPVVCAVGLLVPLVARAQGQPDYAGEAARLLQGIKSEQAKAPALKLEMDRLAGANERLLKEGKLYQEQIKVRLGPIAAAIKADAVRLKADTDRHNQGVAGHNASCTGRLPQPEYQRCMGQKAYWDRNKAGLDARKAQLQARANDHDRQLRQYTVRLDQINAQMKQNFAAWQQKKQAADQIQARLKDYEARFKRVCNLAVQAKNKGGPEYSSNVEEALRYCQSVNWDGTSPNLPPLIDVKPPFQQN
jgi:chromosome segregation ATPase